MYNETKVQYTMPEIYQSTQNQQNVYRVCKLQSNDTFSIHLDTFLTDSVLWSHSFQIMGVGSYKRKHWWQFWKPRKITFIKMMYLGGLEDE